MPKRRRSTTKKRTFRKKRRTLRKRKSFIPRNLIPKKTVRRFRYSTTLQLDPIAGANPKFHVFDMNSMFDPDHTGIGHQPCGFDQYVGVLYDHYTVIGSKITVSFNTTSSSATSGTVRVGITPKDEPSMSLNTQTLIEQGRTRTTVVSPLSSNNSKYLSYKMNPAKFLGISKPMASSNLRGSATANPSEGAYWIVWAANIDGTTDSQNVFCTVLIEYMAVLSEPKFLAGS